MRANLAWLILSRMEHAIRGARPWAAAQGPERPGWRWTLETVALALALTVPFVLGMSALADMRMLPASMPLNRSWPLMDDGAWAAAASAGMLALLTGFVLVALAFVVAPRGDGWRLRRSGVAAACVLIVCAAGPPRAVTVPAWLLAAAALRWWGVTRAPPSWRAPRWAKIAALGAGVALLAATVTYQPFNPLTPFAAKPGQAADAFAFKLTVDGIAGTRILSLTAPDPRGQLDVRLSDPRQLGRHLTAGETVSGTVAIPRTWCPDPDMTATRLMTVLHARVETPLGTRTQLLRLEPGAQFGCPRRR